MSKLPITHLTISQSDGELLLTDNSHFEIHLDRPANSSHNYFRLYKTSMAPTRIEISIDPRWRGKEFLYSRSGRVMDFAILGLRGAFDYHFHYDHRAHRWRIIRQVFAK